MQKSRKEKWVSNFVISTFVLLYLIVSVISTIHVIDFFELSNPDWLAISLAIGFEVGAAASLASLIVLDKINKSVVWVLFLVLTAMQAMGNTYYAYAHLKDFTKWSELFGLIEEDLIYQKRVISVISGAILPLVALGFIKSLVDYIRPNQSSGESEEVEKKISPKEELLDLGSSSDGPGVVSTNSTPPSSNEPEIQKIESVKVTENFLPNIEKELQTSEAVQEEKEITKSIPQISDEENAIEEPDGGISKGETIIIEPKNQAKWYRFFNNDLPPTKNI